MSWWDTDEGDDVIGDEPADLIRHSLQQIAVGKKSKLEDLLRAIGIVAKSDAGKKMLENLPANLRDITATLKSGETLSAQPAEEDATAKDLVTALTDNLRAIQKVYQERWERNPRLSEWLSVFAFVLRYRPEDFLEDGTVHPPANLKADVG
jgi:hypothetical protein